MKFDGLNSIFAVLTAIVGVAILAVLVSKNAQTPQLITNTGTAFAQILHSAVAPVSGKTL